MVLLAAPGSHQLQGYNPYLGTAWGGPPPGLLDHLRQFIHENLNTLAPLATFGTAALFLAKGLLFGDLCRRLCVRARRPDLAGGARWISVAFFIAVFETVFALVVMIVDWNLHANRGWENKTGWDLLDPVCLKIMACVLIPAGAVAFGFALTLAAATPQRPPRPFRGRRRRRGGLEGRLGGKPRSRKGAMTADQRVAVDLNCRRCRYNLRGLALEGRCPECGRPVMASMTVVPDPGPAGLAMALAAAAFLADALAWAFGAGVWLLAAGAAVMVGAAFGLRQILAAGFLPELRPALWWLGGLAAAAPLLAEAESGTVRSFVGDQSNGKGPVEFVRQLLDFLYDWPWPALTVAAAMTGASVPGQGAAVLSCMPSAVHPRTAAGPGSAGRPAEARLRGRPARWRR